MQAFYTWAYYLVVPWAPFHLSPVYTRLFVFDPNDAVFLGSVVIIVGVSVSVWKWRKVLPGVGMVWVYHLVMLVPLLGLTEHPHYTNDRYGQMEGLGFAVLLAGGYVMAMRSVVIPLWKWWVNAGVGLLLACLGFLCFAQATVWHDSETLFTYMIAELGSDRYRADIQWRLAQYYLVKGRVGEALPLLKESLSIDPENKTALHLAGVGYTMAGDWMKSRNIEASKSDAFYGKVHEMFEREASVARGGSGVR